MTRLAHRIRRAARLRPSLSLCDPYWSDTDLFLPFTSDFSDASITARPHTLFGSLSVDEDGLFLTGNASNYLTYSPNATLGADDFTLEFFANPAVLSTNSANPRYWFGTRTTSPDNTNTAWNIRQETNGFSFRHWVLRFSGTQGVGSFSSGPNDLSTHTAVANVEQHVAFVRSGNSLKAFINGQQTNSMDLTPGATLDSGSSGMPLVVGRLGGLTSGPAQGKLKNLRLTKAVRYTENFTPPTGDFPTTQC